MVFLRAHWSHSQLYSSKRLSSVSFTCRVPVTNWAGTLNGDKNSRTYVGEKEVLAMYMYAVFLTRKMWHVRICLQSGDTHDTKFGPSCVRMCALNANYTTRTYPMQVNPHCNITWLSIEYIICTRFHVDVHVHMYVHVGMLGQSHIQMYVSCIFHVHGICRW